jgi:ABC-type polysaccharide/polyol phosphate transport system ATPase subunit
LDEGIGAGDASFLEKAKQRTNEFYKKSGAVIIATHSTELARSFCNRGMVLGQGRKEYDGDIDSAINFYNQRYS